MRFHRSSGFTLIELVVAMSIFAILAAAGWKVFDGLMKVRERATIQAKHLMSLQSVYAQLSRDFGQAIARPVRQSEQEKAALLTDGQSIELTRTGVTDPRLTGQGPLERVRYELRNDELWRLSYAQPDHMGTLQPTATRLIKHVDQFRIQVFNPEASAIWPPLEGADGAQQDGQAINLSHGLLPRGVEVSLTITEQVYVWQFALAPKLPAGAYDAGQPKDPQTDEQPKS